jgi:hypothetical protein
MDIPAIRRAIFIIAISVISMQLFNCTGCDESTTERAIVTWDTLIWDDGSNAPNTLWED